MTFFKHDINFTGVSDVYHQLDNALLTNNGNLFFNFPSGIGLLPFFALCRSHNFVECPLLMIGDAVLISRI